MHCTLKTRIPANLWVPRAMFVSETGQFHRLSGRFHNGDAQIQAGLFTCAISGYLHKTG